MLAKHVNPTLLRCIGSLSILVALLINTAAIELILGKDNGLSAGTEVLVWAFQLYCFSIGVILWFTRSRRFLMSFVFTALFVPVISYATLLAVELFLTLATPTSYEKDNSLIPVVDRPYQEQYFPFTVQWLHPQYLFFLPWKQSTIRDANNDVVSINLSGFRGATPEDRGEKRLAFIVGGSTAFGHGSSSNETTISGYLNQIQDEYHFVNAGVPSWNSSQELHRIIIQIDRYNPELVIAFNGFNDAILSLQREEGDGYPILTPESFELLEEKIGHIHENIDDVKSIMESPIFFPSTRYAIGELKTDLVNSVVTLLSFPMPEISKSKKPTTISRKSTGDEKGRIVTQEQSKISKLAADEYTKNILAMNRYLRVNNTEFLVFFQPFLFFHENIPSDWNQAFGKTSWNSFTFDLRHFISYVSNSTQSSGIFYDFSALFNKYRAQGLTVESVFLDRVHLTDHGNKLVAKELVAILTHNGLLSSH